MVAGKECMCLVSVHWTFTLVTFQLFDIVYIRFYFSRRERYFFLSFYSLLFFLSLFSLLNLVKFLSNVNWKANKAAQFFHPRRYTRNFFIQPFSHYFRWWEKLVSIFVKVDTSSIYIHVCFAYYSENIKKVNFLSIVNVRIVRVVKNFTFNGHYEWVLLYERILYLDNETYSFQWVQIWCLICCIFLLFNRNLSI